MTLEQISQRKILTRNAKIGIVNRGESAVRFIRAVKEFNALYQTRLTTAVFYLEMERDALFVKDADFGYPLARLENFAKNQGCVYLNHNLILEALLDAKCEAVWLGWGFLAEDAVFVAMLEKAGLLSLGPSAQAMALLGDKIAAKKLAEDAGVPVVPWSHKPVESIEQAYQFAEDVGYPVIIKAAHAGGGRGIRVVRKKEELERLFISAREETQRITGDTILFMEYFVEKGRHLEVQVLADRFGVIHTLGVRDCSLQRRQQKIIEETPPAHLGEDVSAALEKAAASIIELAHYESAGTVEFIYDLNRQQFYFMEVNTRLQVEHGITEMLYNVDLVKAQIQIAMCQKLEKFAAAPWGTAMEVRLNAEDADLDFVPAPGEVALYKPPAGPGIRIDSGIEEGSVIPKEFDSMVAKIMTFAPTRAEAMARLERALHELRIKIDGGTTNRAFLLELLQLPEVQKGQPYTRLVEDFLSVRKGNPQQELWDIALLACAIREYAIRYLEELANFKQKFNRLSPPRDIGKASPRDIKVSLPTQEYQFRIKSLGNYFFHVDIDGKTIACRYVWQHGENFLFHGEQRYNIQTVRRGDILQCEVNGIPYPVVMETQGTVRAPSPAIVIAVAIAPNQAVRKGDLLLTLEAMKMEMIVTAPDDGVVKTIHVQKAQQVAAGQALIELETKNEKTKKSGEIAPRISFHRLAVLTEPKNRQERSMLVEMMEREFLGFFLGYDYEEPARKLFSRLSELAERYTDLQAPFARMLLKTLEIYVAIESLFSEELMQAEGFARAMDFQELLLHFFRRTRSREKGLPKQFLEKLSRAMQWYSWEGLEKEEADTRSLFRIYKSHAILPMKQELLRTVLFTLEDLLPKQEKMISSTYLAGLLQEIVKLCENKTPALADAAMHVRYFLVDRQLIDKVKEKKRSKVLQLLDYLWQPEHYEDSEKKPFDDMVVADESVLFDLVPLTLEAPGVKRHLLLELLGKRFNRDRQWEKGEIVSSGNQLLYDMRSTDRKKNYRTVITVIPEAHFPEAAQEIQAFFSKDNFEKAELIILCWAFSRPEQEEEIFAKVMLPPLPVDSYTMGVFFPEQISHYRTFVPSTPEGWKEELRRRDFSPLLFRELRVDRLARFDIQLLYHTESVYLLHGIASNNPEDERFFALVELSDTQPDWKKYQTTVRIAALEAGFSEENTTTRLVAFEAGFVEAENAIRAEQSKRKERLCWNRIIIHIPSFVSMTLQQMEKYASMLVPRTTGLGLEKLVIYARTFPGNNMFPRETEFIFDNVSGTQFSLRRRIPPTNKPLEPMDAYETKVVRARQRGTVYPYEIIKMITHTGPGNEKFPRGDFEEFDIRFDPSAGKYQLVSADRRPYGQNTSNVVFGLLTNFAVNHPYGLKRVIVLADPTTDMASLAEPECRRLIAALDLAQEHKLPVEWVAISSGAKIAMNSGTENLDWTASVLRRIVEFVQQGGEINLIVPGTNVGAQSYWNAEATMLLHTKGVLIMTEDGSMVLTGKKALEFSGGVSAEDNRGIGGMEKIMGPNGEAQIAVKDLAAAYRLLFHHYDLTYAPPATIFPPRWPTKDPYDRDICLSPYNDPLGQGFTAVGDIFSKQRNPERKKPFDMRQVMQALCDQDIQPMERWQSMQDAEIAIVWECRIGGFAVGLLGIESRPLARLGPLPNDGPESWSGGTLFPLSSKKLAHAIHAYSKRLPLVVLANLSGFDGSPESMRNCQLEFGAEIGRAIVNFQGPILFVVVARYHGGAYVVFSQKLNPFLKAIALEGTYASVIGGAPASVVVFPRQVLKETYADQRLVEAQKRLQSDTSFKQKDFDMVFQEVYSEKQAELATKFDQIHSVERAKEVGSIQDIIAPNNLRAYMIRLLEKESAAYLATVGSADSLNNPKSL